MTFLLDLLPVIIFFLAYQRIDLYTATFCLMVTSWLQILFYQLYRKSITLMQWINIILLTLTGSATVVFQDDTFIKWKPTLLYWMFAILCFVSLYFKRINIIKQFLSSWVVLPDALWRKLHYCWIAFFISLGVCNLIIAYTTETKTWVYFKLFGLFSLTVLFFVLQFIFLFRFIQFEHE